MNIVLCILCVIIIAIGIYLIYAIWDTRSKLQQSIHTDNECWQNEVRATLKDVATKKDLSEKTEILEHNTVMPILKEIAHSTELQGERMALQNEGLSRNFQILQDGVNNQMGQLQTSVGQLENSNRRNIQDLKTSLDTGMKDLKTETKTQLQEIKGTVDEQLQDVLDRKLKQSFDSVVKELTNVSKGLGEMSALAGSVGDLKKTLTNVKARGIMGELQLGAILEQILAPEQYEKNVVTVSGTKNPVEFAVKLPGDGNTHVWLPIDSKFPADTYNNLLDAYDRGDVFAIENCGKQLEARILQEAKDINSKYVHVPETTEFAIMFLPTEGLYAEVLRRGLLEKLQSKYKIMIAGPTTMAALLNSLYMGFRTIAVSKRANEVMDLLGNVKSEFGKYQGAVDKVYQRMTQTATDFEALVGTRTRQLSRQLDKISSAATLPEADMNVVDTFTVPVEEEDIYLPFT